MCHLYVLAVVVCPALVDPENGQVELSDMIFGSTATYSCDRGYNLNGSMSRVCVGDGQWSGDDALCQSKRKFHHWLCTCIRVCVYACMRTELELTFEMSVHNHPTMCSCWLQKFGCTWKWDTDHWQHHLCIHCELQLQCGVQYCWWWDANLSGKWVMEWAKTSLSEWVCVCVCMCVGRFICLQLGVCDVHACRGVGMKK